MSAKRKSFEVTRNGKTLTVYPYAHPKTGKPGWRFGWRENERAEWRYVTRATKQEAEDAAWEKLGEMDAGGLVWSGLSGETKRFVEDVLRLAKPADYDAVRRFLEARHKSAEIVGSVARFMDVKVAELGGVQSRHLGNVRRDLEAMAEAFANRSIIDVTDADLYGWWFQRVTKRDKQGNVVMKNEEEVELLAEKTRNDVRGNLVMFWNWAIRDGVFPKDVTPAEKIPRIKKVARSRDIMILTPSGFLEVAREIRVRWRGWLVLCAMCGMRPEEVAPPSEPSMRTRRDKRGLRLEEIDWNFKVIRVPKEVSKVETPRLVPLSDAALAWLKWAGIEEGQTGPVCVSTPTREGETARLGALVFPNGWPQDALRHSYGSYRNAVIRNLSQVAEEMGTSVDMMNKDYHNPRAKEEGEAWFALRPGMIRCDPMFGGSSSDSEELPMVVGL